MPKTKEHMKYILSQIVRILDKHEEQDERKDYFYNIIAKKYGKDVAEMIEIEFWGGYHTARNIIKNVRDKNIKELEQ